MDSLPVPDPQVAAVLRREMLRLAEVGDRHDFSDEAQVPCWSPCPNSVIILRGAAKVMRETRNTLTAGAA